ncbi:MAG: GNAT family N-acetyltransferase [Ruminococcaceae bacterium]|nr:GNAT family N-acetyltransferase [Oscillospiraceae bacterium]
MNYELKTVSFIHIDRVLVTAKILHRCGKDMAEKKNLHHWDNSLCKTIAVVCLELLKNKVFLVYDDNAIGTFGIRKVEDGMYFEKLAILPECSGKGIGSWCIQQIEQMGKEQECLYVTMAVYDKSEHAKEFYRNRGYVFCGERKTRKHTELVMRKDLTK